YTARSILHAYTTEKLGLLFKSQLVSQAQRLSILYHDSKGATDSAFRIQWDAMAVQSVVVDGLMPFLVSAITFIGMIYVMMRLDFTLALIALSVSPVFVLITRSRQTKLRPLWREASQLDTSAMSVVQEVLGALRVVKIFGQEERERRRFDEWSEKG